jgi:glutamate-1-semialdehyde 2,1-aminomutase
MASLTDTRSAELYRRALARIPGGVNSPVRAMGSIGRDPVFIARGEGAELIDVDGNRFVDWVCSWGPLIAGHAHPQVVEAVVRATRDGTSFGAATEGEVELAEEVAYRMANIEMLRMTSSGTEASMTAIRLARAATGREKLIKFAGAYHGHVDSLLAEAGSGLATQGLPASPGVTRGAAADTIVVRWNDRDALRAAVAEHGTALAAIVAEPLPANMGVVAPGEGFLELLRSEASACDALLILDEVISGFRVARGGAQELTCVPADITLLGKIIGGGLPAAALGGPASLMRLLTPVGEVYHAGTLSGNPLGVAAGLATLALLDDTAYLRLSALTQRLADGMRAAAGGYPIQVQSAPGLLTVFFSSTPVRDFEDARACDLDAYGSWCRELLSRGVFPPPSQFEAWFPSLAHTEEHVERTLDAATAAFACLPEGGRA